MPPLRGRFIATLRPGEPAGEAGLRKRLVNAMVIRDYYERHKKLVALVVIGLGALLTVGWVLRARSIGPKYLRATKLTGQ